MNRGRYSVEVDKARNLLVAQALKANRNDVYATAEYLGVTYTTVRSRAKKAGIHLADNRHHY